MHANSAVFRRASGGYRLASTVELEPMGIQTHICRQQCNFFPQRPGSVMSRLCPFVPSRAVTSWVLPRGQVGALSDSATSFGERPLPLHKGSFIWRLPGGGASTRSSSATSFRESPKETGFALTMQRQLLLVSPWKRGTCKAAAAPPSWRATFWRLPVVGHCGCHS